MKVRQTGHVAYVADTKSIPNFGRRMLSANNTCQTLRMLKSILNSQDLMASCPAFDWISISPDCVVYREHGKESSVPYQARKLYSPGTACKQPQVPCDCLHKPLILSSRYIIPNIFLHRHNKSLLLFPSLKSGQSLQLNVQQHSQWFSQKLCVCV